MSGPTTGLIGVGIVGTGELACDHLLPSLADAQLVRPVALFDESPAALARAASLVPDVVAASEWSDFAAAPGLDYVHIAASNGAHEPLAAAAAAAGLHVLCEKPLAPTVAAARRIVATCRTAGVLLATAFTQRHHEAHLWLRRAVRAGDLGQVLSLRLEYSCWLPPSGWRADPTENPGGALLDLAIHGLDLCQYLLDDPIVALEAVTRRSHFDYPAADGAALAGLTRTGTALLQHVGYDHSGPRARRVLELVGTDASALATDTMGQTAGGQLEITDSRSGARRMIPLTDARSPFAVQADEFARAIAAGSTADTGVDVLELIESVRPVRVTAARAPRTPRVVNDPRPPGRLRYAYNTNGLVNHRLADALVLLSEAGYEGVALTLDHSHMDPYADQWQALADRVARELERLHLGVVIETGARYLLDPRAKHEPTLLSPHPASRARRLDFLRRAVEIAALMGAEAVSLWAGVIPPSVSDVDAWSRLLDGLSETLTVAERHGVTIALEPEPGMLVETIDDYRRIADELPALTAALDLGHCLVTGGTEPVDAVYELAGSLGAVAIEDMRRGVHEHLPFGEGDMDLPAVLAALAEVGYGKLVSVELPRYAHVAPTMVRDSIEVLREAELQQDSV